MNRLSPHSWNVRIWSFLLACLALLALLLLHSIDFQTADASPAAQATPTCPPTGCAQARVYGYQPRRYDMRSTFNDAASNTLGNNGPSYDRINRGLPPNMTQETVSASRPIPHIVLRGMAWQESHWLQFANAVSDPDDTYACTLVSGDCGYGLMQITSCMSDGCGWFTPNRVAGELAYNLGTGTNYLIQKWNQMPFIGGNDHPVAEQWYYAVTAYNGWSWCNDPNRNTYASGCPYPNPFYPDRPPYGEGNYSAFGYPYQETIWGWATHPENTQAGLHWLWRPVGIAAVPRGIFGLGSGWQPPSQTPKPVYHLLPGVRVANSGGPTIVLRNMTGQTLAADIALYNADHTFNRWWLGAPRNDAHSYPYRYIRLSPHETRSFPVTDVFYSWEAFTGYARVSASEGIEVTLQPPSYPNKVFLPLALKNYGGNCYNEVWNGGFEEFVDGRPRYWTVSSADAYPLADGTWFASGHYGAYLGGYDRWESDDDKLSQSISIPSDALSANLTYRWYMRTEETHPSNQYDFLRVRLRDPSDNLVATLDTVSNQSPRDTWQTAMFDLLPYGGQSLKLSLEADNDVSNPTSFFVDDVSLWICRP